MSKFGNFLLNLKLIKSVIKWSEDAVLPGFKGFRVYDVMNIFFKNVQEAQINDRAGSISFFLLLAIPPTCIFLFTLLPYIPLENLESTIYIFVRDITPNEKTYNLVHGIIFDFLHTQRTGLLSFSFLLAIFYSSTAVTGILRSFNRDHPGFTRRNMIKQRWMGIKLNCVLIFLLVFVVIFMVLESAFLTNLLASFNISNEAIRILIFVVRWTIIVLFFFITISILYTYGPSTVKNRKFITAGSIIATGLTILSTVGFSFYVNNFSSYNRIYGSIGSLIVLMIWIFINSYVLLIGFELNTSIEILEQQAGRALTSSKKQKKAKLRRLH